MKDDNQPKSHPRIHFFCALDWGRRDHYYVLKDPHQKVLSEGYFESSHAGFKQFLAQLEASRGSEPVALIIEANQGAPFQALIEVPWLVLCLVNPVKTRKLQELDGSGRGKSDPRDSHLLCDYLIGHYSDLVGYVERDGLFRTLSVEVGLEEDLIAEQTRLINRIQDWIYQVCPDLRLVAGKIKNTLFQDYVLRFSPMETDSREAVRQFLQNYRLRSADLQEQLVQQHSQARPLGEDCRVQEALWERIRCWVRGLQTFQKELKACEKRIDKLFAQLPQAPIYRSLNMVGPRLAPRLATLFGSDPSKAFANAAQANAYFGQSPVTHSSGGMDKKKRLPSDRDKKQVLKRLSCNRFARHTCFLWSRCCAMSAKETWQKQFLQRHKDRGDQPGTRYRKLGRKQVQILFRCLVDNRPYDDDLFCRSLHNH